MSNPNGDPSSQTGNRALEPGMLQRAGTAALNGVEVVADFLDTHGLGPVSARAGDSAEHASADRRHAPGDHSAYDRAPDSWGSTRRT